MTHKDVSEMVCQRDSEVSFYSENGSETAEHCQHRVRQAACIPTCSSLPLLLANCLRAITRYNDSLSIAALVLFPTPL